MPDPSPLWSLGQPGDICLLPPRRNLFGDIYSTNYTNNDSWIPGLSDLRSHPPARPLRPPQRSRLRNPATSFADTVNPTALIPLDAPIFQDVRRRPAKRTEPGQGLSGKDTTGISLAAGPVSTSNDRTAGSKGPLHRFNDNPRDVTVGRV